MKYNEISLYRYPFLGFLYIKKEEKLKQWERLMASGCINNNYSNNNYFDSYKTLTARPHDGFNL